MYYSHLYAFEGVWEAETAQRKRYRSQELWEWYRLVHLSEIVVWVRQIRDKDIKRGGGMEGDRERRERGGEGGRERGEREREREREGVHNEHGTSFSLNKRLNQTFIDVYILLLSLLVVLVSIIK